MENDHLADLASFLEKIHLPVHARRLGRATQTPTGHIYVKALEDHSFLSWSIHVVYGGNRAWNVETIAPTRTVPGTILSHEIKMGTWARIDKNRIHPAFQSTYPTNLI